ncbi:uncharacterized protein zgc:113425 isoform X2 [Boleophthalmus pectinirostris]|uniref:uncharacterized protein zgc:113425 isoform X2 n=1 Tax=Boleophthalmus pectinirostris TaxID=150288 RepID=UPI00242B16F6|nr:uncharacterized protein zgc:113425 isoform X2 [Boleophthalmus pectinirostris]
MDRYRYLMLAQGRMLVLGVLQIACAGLCVICGVMDAVFRKDTPLSTTRTPIWGGMIMAVPGVLALFASQRKNHILVSALILCAGLSCAASVFVSGYSCLTLTYGEEDTQVFHHHKSPEVRFVLHRLVKGANVTILLSCGLGLLLSSAIAFLSCRSLPLCACYDYTTGLESLVPQCEPGDTELVCTWRGDNDDERLFNSPAQSSERSRAEEEEQQQQSRSTPPPYSRLT